MLSFLLMLAALVTFALASLGIIAATTATVLGSLDGASFAAIIGAAIGGVSVSAGTVLSNGPPREPRRVATETPSAGNGP